MPLQTVGARLSGVILVLLLASASVAFGQTAPASGKVGSPGGYEALAAKIGQRGAVRLLVRVDTAFQPMASPSSAASLQQMSRIASTQDVVLASLATFKLKEVHKYSYVPYLFLDVDEPALQAILALPLVLDVHEDIPVPPVLDLSVPRIGAPSVWDMGVQGAGIAVAVLDTGVDKNHPFLNGSVVSEACYSTNYAPQKASSVCPGGVTDTVATNSALPYGGNCPAGECDHGTHVSGIIAGRQGVAGSPGPGVAPLASIIAIQVFSRFDDPVACSPYASCVMSYSSDQIKGLERVYALRTTYDVASVNMSLGGGRYTSNCDSDPLKPIIDNLKAAGIATVIASGNNGYCGSISAPACISSAVSVGATTDSDTVASYSNSAGFMSLLAPGSSIKSSVPGGGYASWNGTSMATPHVAGAWALMKQAKPAANVDQILASFTTTGLSVTDTGKCSSVAKKRINVFEAASPSLVPLIKANGATGSITVAQSTPVSITVSLDPGNKAGQNADWWLAASTPSGWYSYVHPAGWSPEINLAVQTPLFTLYPAFEALKMNLTAGDYTFYFGVDLAPNQVLDSPLTYDSVQVHVTQ